jgi:hypothetical protein
MRNGEQGTRKVESGTENAERLSDQPPARRAGALWRRSLARQGDLEVQSLNPAPLSAHSASSAVKVSVRSPALFCNSHGEEIYV